MVAPTTLLAADSPRSSEALDPTRDRDLWERVGRLIDRARSPADLRVHRLEAVAAWHWSEHGLPVPSDFAEHARGAGAVSLVAPLLLSRVRVAAAGAILVLKGPESAARYPSPAMRPYGDLDLLVREPLVVQRALEAAGFTPTGDPALYRDLHHLRPLRLEGFPLILEVHGRPKWPAGVQELDLDELFDVAVDSATAVDGVSALPPAEAALLLAAHAWAHVPLARLFHLVDIAAMRQDADADETASLASRWGLDRLWETTSSAIDCLFYERDVPWALRSWARHLPRVRERTVLETHLTRWLAGFSALPPATGLRTGVGAVVRDARPARDESWGDKWFRSRRAVTHALSPRSQHEAKVDLELRRRHRRKGDDSSGVSSDEVQVDDASAS